ncbi:hypothetical protein O181_043143 [Austropuccinia psidii MF-1]|uniref:Uncharacterized protein n=1 Tax=Austropuccinia psidii MF-1 TaxID=1389203 RepID=A0A9Q3DMH9_9BASI|nr:hypothetical protein [Austropuccinia psidii MF-1]
MYTSKTLVSKGTSQRTEKAFPELEDLEEDTLDTVLDGKTLSKIILTLPFKFQSKQNLKPEDWKKHGPQEVQPSIPLGRTGRKLPDHISQRDRLLRPYGNNQRLESHQAVQTPGGEGKQDKGESSHYPSYRRTTEPVRECSDSFRLTRSRQNQLSSGFKPFRNQQISDQESPFFTIPGHLQEKTRIPGQK